MFLVKVGTAVVVPLGPAVSATDGIAFVTGLAGTGAGKLESTSSGIHLIKNGGAAAVRHATATASTEDALSKSYLVTLDTTDTATVGTLRVGFNVAGCLDMKTDCMVVAAKVYDSIVAGSDNLEVDAIQLLGTAWLTPTVAGTPDVNTKTITAGAITATAIADNAIDNATFAADVGSTAYATNKIALAADKAGQNGVNLTKVDGAALGTHASGLVGVDVRDMGGSALSATSAQIGVNIVNVDNAALSTHASGMLPADLRDIAGATVSTSAAQLGVHVVSMASDSLTADAVADDVTAEITAGLASAADIADAVWDEVLTSGHAVGGSASVILQGIGTDTDTIITGVAVASIATDAITAASIHADAITAAKIANGAIDNATFAADVGSTAYATNILALAADKAGLHGVNVIQLDGASLATHASGLIGADVRDIGGAAVSTTTAQLGVAVVSVANNAITAAAIAAGAIDADALATDAAVEIAGKVWDEVLDTAHEVAGSSSVLLQSAGGGADAATIADAVWEEALSGHTGSGKAGQALADAGSGADSAAIADAVLTEALADHTGAGSLSKGISDLLTNLADLHTDVGTVTSDVAAVHVHVGTIDGHITADYGSTEKAAVDLLDDAVGGLADIHTDVGTVTSDVAAIHVHVGTIDGHVTADYGTTEKAAIDLLDDAVAGLVDIHTDVAAVKSDTAAILTDTGTTLDGRIPAALVSGRMDASIGAVAVGVDFSPVQKASINTEVADVLTVDAQAEPGQGTPAANASIAAKLGYLFKSWRNKKTGTATQFSLFNDDASTVDQKSTLGESGGTVTVGEVATGP